MVEEKAFYLTFIYSVRALLIVALNAQFNADPQ